MSLVLYSVLIFVSLVGIALVLVFLVLGCEDRVLSLGVPSVSAGSVFIGVL